MAAVAMLLTVGFCWVDVNPLGPVQEYTAPLIVEAVSDNTDAAHTGPLLAAVGADGIEFTVTVVVPAVLLQLFRVAITL